MNSVAQIPPYSRADILQWLGPDNMAKAISYVPKVSNMQWVGSRLTGLVEGTATNRYKVNVYFTYMGRQIAARGVCTCPVGPFCKHVTALLIAGIDLQSAKQSDISFEVVNWLEQFRQRHNVVGIEKKQKLATQVLIYAVETSPYYKHHEVLFYKASLDREGEIRSFSEPWNNVDRALSNPPKFIGNEDLEILRLLWIGRSRNDYGNYRLIGANGAAALEKMLATGRMFGLTANSRVLGKPLCKGKPRNAHMKWELAQEDKLQPTLETDPPSSEIIFTEPFWYIDRANGEAGIVESSWDNKRLVDYLSIPPLTFAESTLVSSVLRDVTPDLPMPPSEDSNTVRVIDVEPIPVLQLNTVPVYSMKFSLPGKMTPWDHAVVHFDYEEFRFKMDNNSTLVKAPNGGVAQIKRRKDIEARRLAELKTAGLVRVPNGQVYGQNVPIGMMSPPTPENWPEFMRDAVPKLRSDGWKIEMTDNFSFNVVEIEDIDANLQEAADGWFDVEMGITIGDRSIRLEPLLAELFRRDRRWLSGGIDNIAADEMIDLKTDRNERLRLRADRLKPIVRVLIDLFEGLGSGDSLRVSRFDAGRLEALNDTGRWQFHGDESVRTLAKRLKDSAGVSEVAIPKGLSAELRPYQHQGLSWMQFLREQNLSGVLADDMGLGKTVQTLAHLLTEKEAGRLDRPALIVVPTSLVHNWCDEAARFAPTLRVLSLQGIERREKFEQIPDHDLVLTTYALLWRDQEVLSKYSYHILILDEAQTVKNATTKSATTIRELDARHRLCLTGTPLENHLGELWSLFDFLLPGFLGTGKDFTKRWRTPIEKGGDTARRDLLACRIRPFILRRRKDDVAKELPPKTIIVRTVDLEGGQRDLYETVRSAMQEKVRTAIAEHGLNRSHIVVLDALLKLRQVCCDARLVKLKKAASVKESAKLDLLMSMLPELIEEGRRILLFSQFTSMLELISNALDKVGITYVTLTGETKNRAAPVRQFQAGEVPLFLISLKAGGVGLNLTAADTVIHYDPWWNPATENQATDRAHRLGQDKPVFVYKLIVAGSIEEKIISLQERKAALAEGILSNDGSAAVKFSANDLEALFSPMPVSK